MNTVARRFSTASTKNALERAGSGLKELAISNPGKNVAGSIEGIDEFEKAVEADHPDPVHTIQGSKLHHSTKDPNETKEVITVSVHTAGGTRLLSGHIRKDGTYTTQLSRAGRKSCSK